MFFFSVLTFVFSNLKKISNRIQGRTKNIHYRSSQFHLIVSHSCAIKYFVYFEVLYSLKWNEAKNWQINYTILNRKYYRENINIHTYFNALTSYYFVTQNCNFERKIFYFWANIFENVCIKCLYERNTFNNLNPIFQ